MIQIFSEKSLEFISNVPVHVAYDGLVWTVTQMLIIIL
jgi:hypothetical protein